MSSKYNPGSRYEDDEMQPITVESLGPQFTIVELMDALRALLIRYPGLAHLPVFHAEGYGLIPSRKLEVPPDGSMMVIDQ